MEGEVKREEVGAGMLTGQEHLEDEMMVIPVGEGKAAEADWEESDTTVKVLNVHTRMTRT
jgi:hypothetical protein